MNTGRNLLILMSFCLAGISALAQPSGSPNSTQMVAPKPPEVLNLKETGHNFGKIPQGRPATYVFEVINIGQIPLRLDNVQASCGCTTPEWSRDAIAPGAVAQIKVGYNAHAEGAFTKTVTITYNGNQTKILTITGDVYKTPMTSAPENASVQFLKQINQ
jgi:hypothetical protein